VANETRTREVELGPIRPPSEAASLLLRVTRNCPWNDCAFCAVYKGERFGRRPVEDILADVDLLAEAAARVLERAGVKPGGAIDPAAALAIVRSPGATEDERRMALWLARGGEHVFLQDADSLVLPAERLVPVLERLKERFPAVNRITTYARSRTLCARSPSHLAALKGAGLTRIHVGVESGSDAVLALIRKGCRAEHHVEGCKRAIDAGFEVCCYVMPGLGGRALTKEHAAETAAALRAIDPHHVRLRTLWIDRGAPLAELRRDGLFEMLEEHEVVAEIRDLLRGLRGLRGAVISDHDRNLLPELEGRLTADADALDAAATRFLELPPRVRDAFVVARRSGYFLELGAFLADEGAADEFAPIAERLAELGGGSLRRGVELGLRLRHI
jgi:biotin synthase-like enzyme